ncbi:MAG: Uncharacterised protein [Owenweeksia sp. TMED14]|nr:MAG: Uncharacterised protein [Owenweeksia sp. TMED14]|tara:strand:- start:703 stop:1524 length:822 start_codon:yes stop_codon:yes gene_type:complete
MTKRKRLSILVLGFFLISSACDTTTALITTGNDPNFIIVAHNDAGFIKTNRKVNVFGIPIYAYSNVEDSKLLHTANILAQYLDNNEDGFVDNITLLNALTANNGALFMWKTESQINLNAQDLGADESIPSWHSNGNVGEFDSALEEVWHVITHNGYANAYPTIFGENPGTALTKSMDLARGGNFTSIPNPYPSDAWYTYNDQTCEYDCMATEYIYWAMTSILGAHENRFDEISQEWNLNTRSLVQTIDTAVFALLTDPQYMFPKVLPDGTYKH